MSKAFENFMDEYREKVNPNSQAQEIVNLDDMGVQPTKAVNHEGGTAVARNAAATQSSPNEANNGGAAQSFSAPLLTAGPSKEALILAQTCVLLSRSLAYVGLSSDLNCARQLAVEIRDQLDAINAYALSRGIGMELADALLKLMGANGELVGFTPSDASA